MNTSNNIPYIESDLPIKQRISELYSSLFLKMKEFEFEDYKYEDITTYGIYPNYSQQKLKILFIGREARGLSGCDYIDMLFSAYKGKNIGGTHINQSSFHRRMLKVAYYLNNPDSLLENIPSASDISETFGSPSGVSFAFMNFSKFSNESKSWNTKWGLLSASNIDNDFTRNFAEIVNPDLIISMGLRGILTEVFRLENKENIGSAFLFKGTANTHSFDLIDGYHYSALNIKDIEDVLDPVVRYLKKKKET